MNIAMSWRKPSEGLFWKLSMSTTSTETSWTIALKILRPCQGQHIRECIGLSKLHKVAARWSSPLPLSTHIARVYWPD